MTMRNIFFLSCVLNISIIKHPRWILKYLSTKNMDLYANIPTILQDVFKYVANGQRKKIGVSFVTITKQLLIHYSSTQIGLISRPLNKPNIITLKNEKWFITCTLVVNKPFKKWGMQTWSKVINVMWFQLKKTFLFIKLFDILRWKVVNVFMDFIVSMNFFCSFLCKTYGATS